MSSRNETKPSPWTWRPAGLARSTLSALVLSGPGLPVLFVVIYAWAYLARFPLVEWYAHIPKASFVTITGRHPLPAVGLALANLALALLCWRVWALALSRPTPALRRLILFGWFGATLCAVFTFAGQSTDMGDYIFRAHMLVHLHQNPLTTPPSQVIALKDVPYLSWYWEPDFYGPLWQWLSAAVHALAGESLLANYLAYKTLAAGAMALSGWIIYRILLRTAPRYALAGLALWLWNPLVLNEGPLHGHNDMVIVPLVLGSLWLTYRRRAAPAILLAVAILLVKANLWFLLPVELFWLLLRRQTLTEDGLPQAGERRRGFWQEGLGHAIISVGLGLLVGALLVWLAYLPFGGWHRLVEMAQHRGWWPTETWTAAVFFWLRDGLHALTHQQAVRWVIGGGTALFLAISAFALWRIRDLFLVAWAVALAYLLVGSQWFMPWYAVWLIAIAALIPDKRVALYTLVFSAFMLLHPIVEQYWLAGEKFGPGGFHAAMAATTMLVPQLLTAYLVLSRRTQGQTASGCQRAVQKTR